MSSVADYYSSPGGGFFRFIFIFVLVVIVLFIGYTFIVHKDISHAEKHGSGALAGRLLCDGQKSDETWKHEKYGRCAYITKEDTGKVFIQITEMIEGKEQEITFYIKDNWKVALDAVKRYGYSPP